MHHLQQMAGTGPMGAAELMTELPLRGDENRRLSTATPRGVASRRSCQPAADPARAGGSAYGCCIIVGPSRTPLAARRILLSARCRNSQHDVEISSTDLRFPQGAKHHMMAEALRGFETISRRPLRLSEGGLICQHQPKAPVPINAWCVGRGRPRIGPA